MENKRIKIYLNDISAIKKFLQVARSFDSDVDVITDRVCLDGKSILGLYNIDLSQEIYTQIITDDKEEYSRFIKGMECFQK